MNIRAQYQPLLEYSTADMTQLTIYNVFIICHHHHYHQTQSTSSFIIVIIKVSAVNEEEEDSREEGHSTPGYGHPEAPAQMGVGRDTGSRPIVSVSKASKHRHCSGLDYKRRE